MTDETIRIGIVGAGNIVRSRHLPGFNAIEDVELVSVCNRTRESSQRVADDFGVARVYDSWADLIAAPDTNAICIGTWPYMHRTLVLAALDAGKHVLTQARFAMNGAQARAMLEASLGMDGLVTQVVPAPFTLQADATIKELIADGYLGDMLSVDLAVSGGAFIDGNRPYTWRHDRDLSGYNILLVGAWYECMMRWLGPATSVTAVTRVHVPSRADASGAKRVINIPDHVEIIAEMASGPLAHMRFSDSIGLAGDDRFWLFGTEGTLLLEILSGNGDHQVRLSGGRRGDSRLQEIEIQPEKRGGWRVEEEFINAIRGVEQVTTHTFEDGVRYMEFTEAVTRSAQSGKRVHLPL